MYMGFMDTGSNASRRLSFAEKGSFWKLVYEDENFWPPPPPPLPWRAYGDGDGLDGVVLRRRAAGSGPHCGIPHGWPPNPENPEVGNPVTAGAPAGAAPAARASGRTKGALVAGSIRPMMVGVAGLRWRCPCGGRWTNGNADTAAYLETAVVARHPSDLWDNVAQ